MGVVTFGLDLARQDAVAQEATQHAQVIREVTQVEVTQATDDVPQEARYIRTEAEVHRQGAFLGHHPVGAVAAGPDRAGVDGGGPVMGPHAVGLVAAGADRAGQYPREYPGVDRGGPVIGHHAVGARALGHDLAEVGRQGGVVGPHAVGLVALGGDGPVVYADTSNEVSDRRIQAPFLREESQQGRQVIPGVGDDGTPLGDHAVGAFAFSHDLA